LFYSFDIMYQVSVEGAGQTGRHEDLGPNTGPSAPPPKIQQMLATKYSRQERHKAQPPLHT